jgi:shikimate dehydrogenase
VALAARVQDAWPRVSVDTEMRVKHGYDIAITGTSLGMEPGDEPPMPLDVIEAASLLAEGVIAPKMTRSLEVAKSKGRAVHTRAPMLAAQMHLMLRVMLAREKEISL